MASQVAGGGTGVRTAAKTAPAKAAPKGKPAPKAKAPAKGKAKQPVTLANANLGQLTSEAGKEAAAEVKAQEQPLLDEQHVQDQQNTLHGQAIQGFSTALASLLGTLPSQVHDIYSGAENAQAGFAKGYSDTLQQTLGQNQQQSNSFLQSLGAPASAMKPTPDVGDVTYALGGALPATRMSGQGANQEALAAMQPGLQMERGQQAFESNIAQGRTADQTILTDIQKLAATSPGLARTILNDLLTQQHNAQDLALRVHEANVNDFYKRAELGVATKKEAYTEWLNQQKLGMAQQNQSFNQWAKQQGLAIQGQRVSLAAQTAANNASLAAQRVAISWANVGLSKARLKAELNKAHAAATNGGFTAHQVQVYKGEAATIADNARHGFTDSKGTAHAALTYAQAVKEMLKSGIPLTIAVDQLNRVYPVQYQVTNRGLVQTSITGQPNYAGAVQNAGPQHAKMVGYISNRAPQFRLDPAAVLAVASQEGLGGGVGDGGTSFGPFQMHIGGALPAAIGARGAAYAQAWAWSPAGIDYALRQMAQVAAGLTGRAAVDAIVRRFERPANPTREVAGANAAYGRH